LEVQRVRPEIEWAEVDLTHPDELGALMSRVRPAITFNLAGYGVDPSEREDDLLQHLNVDLVDALLECIAAARRPWAGQALVHVGSSAEYGRHRGVVDESSPTEPSSAYGKSKLAGTRRLAEKSKALELRALTARLFSVYGPGEHPQRLLPSLIRSARSGEPLDLTGGRQKRDFTYVDDVATGLLLLGVSDGRRGEVVNLASGILTSVREFAELAAELLGVPRQHLRFGTLPTRPNELRHGHVVIDRLRALASWSPPTVVREGIARTLEGESPSGHLGETE
jgi:nucleoside-diphosphate-sugar epimerase